MIVFSAVLKAKGGKEKAVEDALMAMIPNVQTEKNTMVYIIHRSQNDAGVFFLYEKYKDKEAFDYHMSTTYLNELLKKFGEILAEEPQIEVYEEIASINS